MKKLIIVDADGWCFSLLGP